MSPDEPAWWYGPQDALAARLLAPAAWAWQKAGERRWARTQPYRARLPVICIGNFTAGGTGKTPLSLRVARTLIELGAQPVLLTRGYGGRLQGPHWVVPGRDRAADTGDEPLLLAEVAPVMVARDRAAGARAIEAAAGLPGPAHDVIVMDDGLQNPALAMDLALAVVDGRRGLGNGRVIPAGPLRAPLEAQLARVDAIVVNQPDPGPGSSATLDWLKQRFAGPVLAATTMPLGDTAWLRERPVIAFAGIGAPARFFDLLGALGATVVQAEAFPDHHPFSVRQAKRLLRLAREQDALLVTTDKDRVRLAGASHARGALWEASRTLSIAMTLGERDAGRLTALLTTAIRAKGLVERR